MVVSSIIARIASCFWCFVVSLIGHERYAAKSTEHDDTNDAICKAEQDEVASRLAKAIVNATNFTDTTPVRHAAISLRCIIPGHISGTFQDGDDSMDTLHIIQDPTNDSMILGVFHAALGRMTSGFFALYIAQAPVPKNSGHVPIGEEWEILAKLTDRGSQPHLKMHPDGIQVFLTYEYSSFIGNTIAIRLYRSIDDLKRGSCNWINEVFLNPFISLPIADNEVSTRKCHVTSLGTPTISDIIVENNDIIHLSIRFHYFPSVIPFFLLDIGFYSDLPGFGSVDFPISEGRRSGNTNDDCDYDLDQYYKDWDGQFDVGIKNALRKSEVVGKLGQRANLHWTNSTTGTAKEYLLLEGQMADDGEGSIGWLSWRPLLHQMHCNAPASLLPLTIPNDLQTLANPHITVMDDWLYVGFFVPGEPFIADITSSYQNFDSENCPTCADNPMEQATPPAGRGSMLFSVPLKDIL